MKRSFLFYVLLITFDAFANKDIDFEKHFKLLPQPKSITTRNEKGISPTTIHAVYLKGASKRPVLYGLLKNLPLAASEGAGVVVMNLSNATGVPESAEGYTLNVSNKQIVISARTEVGLFYGAVTLAQLIEDAQDQQIEIPSCTITDYPDIAYRAIHLDLKHHLDAGHYYYTVIDRLAQIKINAIIVEFEDKLR